MKKVYIMLTRTQSIVSKIVYFFTRASYTHASLVFDKGFNEIYSSTRKNGVTLFPAGPAREYLDRGFFARHGKTPCAVYEFEVTEEVYDKLYAETMSFINNSDCYKFNVWGLVSCKFGIPLYRKNKYFCSQFVAEILSRCDAVPLPKETGLMRPSDYMTMPELTRVFEGDIGELSAFCAGEI